MRPIVSLTLAAAVLFPAVLRTQVTPHERALPKPITGGWGNGAATYNPARDGTRLHQTWFRGDNLPTGFIVLEVGERIGKAASAAMSLRLTLVLDNSSLSWGQMNADPTKNLSSSATKLFDKTLNLPADAGGSSPDNVHAWMKLDRPWPFTGPNLIIQKTWTPGTTAIGVRKYDTMSVNPTRHRTSGTSCGGTLAATHLNGSYTATLTGAPANVVALFMLSTENVSIGPIRLPIDLGIVGLKGCELGVDPQFILPVATDGTGRAVLSAPVAIPTNDTIWWSVQVMHQDSAKTSWKTTNVMTTMLGGTGLCRQLRVDKRGTKGPDLFNTTGPIMLIRGR